MPSPLAYFFWHWKQPDVSSARYEAALRGFHASLRESPPRGFIRSVSTAVIGAPWANAGAEAYVDRYVIEDASALDRLDDAIGAMGRHRKHDTVAHLAAAGAGGVSRLRLGEVVEHPRHAFWFNKVAGMSYEDIFRALEPAVRRHSAVLWMRKMVLGPSPEFCLEADDMMELPNVSSTHVTLSPVWS
jgi:hypothetical protein